MPIETTATGKFDTPWKIAGTDASDIEFRDATVEDLCKAEEEGNPSLHPYAFNVALAAETCVRAGNYTGPFTPGHFRKMSQKRWAVVRKTMNEAAELGEG